MRSTTCAVAATTAVLALAGCGGNNATPAASTAARAGTRPDAPPPAAGRAPRDALIRIADLSNSWRPFRSTPIGLECGQWDPLAGAKKRVESPRFERSAQVIQQTLALYPDAEASGQAFRRLNAPATERCMRRALRLRLRFFSGRGIAFVEPVKVVRVESLGRYSHGIRYSTELNAELGRATAYIVTINSRVGPAVASLTAVSGASALAEAAYDVLTERAERRLLAVFG